MAILHESDLVLSEDVVETIVDKVLVFLTFCFSSNRERSNERFLMIFYSFQQTFREADAKGDGKIDQEEWKEFVSKNPSLIRNMTLPYLKCVLIDYTLN